MADNPRLLDTDVMVDLMRGYPAALIWFDSLSDEEAPGLVGVVVMELIRGCRNQKEKEVLKRRLRLFEVFWPTQQDMEAALPDLWTYSLSHGLGIMDALIGRCAFGLGATLCTFNQRDFSLLVGLSLEQPYARV